MQAEIPSYEDRTKWFHEARFGIFVHWGVYSIPARGEWVMHVERIPKEEYATLADQFNPERFNAGEWAAMARDAGAKYMVLTTRHHDGFCLFDSKVSDFTSVKTAAKRDFVAEYVDACRRAGLKIGFYYSWVDWRFPGYFDRKKHPESFAAMVNQAGAQIRELMTNYGKIDILWYDGHWIPDTREEELAALWNSREVNAMVRKLQPHILINNRSGLPEDLDTPEQHVTASGQGRAWESCMTIGDSCGWGYIRHNPNLKTTAQLIQYLVTAASGEGNYLLNVGPRSDGTIQPEFVSRLEEIGRWLKTNGEATYGSRRAPFGGGILGLTIAKDNVVYVHVFRWPGRTACVPGVAGEVKGARLLATGQDLTTRLLPNGRLMVDGMPENPPDPHCSVVAIEFSGQPRRY